MEARVAESEGFKEALMIENVSLNEKVNKLVDDLSEKEAKWCETEEQMNQRVSYFYCFLGVEGWNQKLPDYF